jgi:Transient receptor potential (TRP) ion channel/ML-like domain
MKAKVLWGVALLTYLCAPPVSAQVLSVQKVQACDRTTDINLYQLNLTYNVGASTLYFYTDGESNRLLPNATAGLTILLYGSPVYSTVFDLCSFNQPFLCPIQPNTQFNITVNQTLPSNVIGQIPSFLFGLPDLGLQSKVTIQSPAVGNESLCIVTTMASPGAASLQSPVAEWLSLGLLIGVIVNGLISFVKSLLGDGSLDTAVSTTSFPRVTDVVLFFQYVSYTGQMSLSYPELYRAFTLNFGWAMGLMNVPFIDNIVSGGSSQNETTSTINHLINIMKRDAVLPMDTPANTTVDGIKAYAEALNVPTHYLFLRTLLVFVLLLALLTVLMFLVWVLIGLLAVMACLQWKKLRAYAMQWPWLYIGYASRLVCTCMRLKKKKIICICRSHPALPILGINSTTADPDLRVLPISQSYLNSFDCFGLCDIGALCYLAIYNYLVYP